MKTQTHDGVGEGAPREDTGGRQPSTSPGEASGETNPANTLTSDFQDYERIGVCCLSHIVGGALLHNPS